MRRFVCPLLIVTAFVPGLVAVGVAQDLDAPTRAEPVSEEGERRSTFSSLFDALVARIQQGEADILASRRFYWRDLYWEIWAWESSATTLHDFLEQPEWWNTDSARLARAAETFAGQREQLSAAEQAALHRIAGDAHRRIALAGLN